MNTYYFRHKGFKECFVQVNAKTQGQAWQKLREVVAHRWAWVLVYIWVVGGNKP